MHGLRLDHATIRSAKLKETIEFYGELLGFSPGWRPPLQSNGAWLYAKGGDYPILHVIEVDEDIGRGGMFDHVAFRGVGLLEYLDKLRAAGQRFEARRVPETPYTQVHQYDPNGVKIEITFEETHPADALRCDLDLEQS
jgi:catechol 2,3-dioxygenase-like lactoylglutathione lyase family enzyme